MKYPTWLNRQEYPFETKFAELKVGKMNYVDEGSGAPIIFLHGNPSWSFDYRNVIKNLSNKYRCIANDHIGFGLSDKPRDWDYLPESHAKNFEEFVDQLNVDNFTIVVNDWGGPIGLAYAIKYPEKINAIVIANTWMWPVNGDFHFEAFSKIMGGPIGKYLSGNYNFFARVIGKLVFGDRNPTPEIFKHYYSHLPSKEDRKGTWVFPRHITGSKEWLAGLWRQKDKISKKPALGLWGMKDIAFREKELIKWKEVFEDLKIVKLEKAGHFPQEEDPDRYSQELEEFIRTNVTPNSA
jgi:haloalkane dehalogenase